MEEPDITCPIIDDAKERIQNARDELEKIERVIRDIYWELDQADSELERVRSANSDLREYGRYWENQAFDLSRTLESLRKLRKPKSQEHVEKMKGSKNTFAKGNPGWITLKAKKLGISREEMERRYKEGEIK